MPKDLITAAQAIQRVFNIPVKSSRRLKNGPSLSSQSPCFCARHSSFTSRPSAAVKPFVVPPTAPPTARPRVLREIDPRQYGPKSAAANDDEPRDADIPHRDVVVRLPDNKLSQVRKLRDVLDERMMDEKGRFSQFVRVIAEADPSVGRLYPIVGYFGKQEEKERELAAKKNHRDSAQKEKRLELSWAIGDHDLQHRMAQLHKFLQKGMKVEIIFGSKAWRVTKKVISEDEGQSLLDKIQQSVLQMEGARVVQEFKGKITREGNMIIEGPSKKPKKPSVVVDTEKNVQKAA